MKERERYLRHFGVEPPENLGLFDVWPGYAASFIRRPRKADVGDEAVPKREALPGQFGLIPHWATDITISRRTYNARSETVGVKPSFRDAWRHSQHCIIPAEAFFEPDWRTGKAIATRIALTSGEPMGIAGLWSVWRSPAGDMLHSFTMLTVNADDHAFMKHYHKPNDEKRMVVILPHTQYDEWLHASPERSIEFMRQYSHDRLMATPVTQEEHSNG